MMKGLHEMLVNLIFAVIMDPKESLNNHVTLAFLGSVSDKLKMKCDWSNEAYQTAVNACVRKNVNMRDQSFLPKCFGNPERSHGPYIRKVVAEIDEFTINTSSFDHAISSGHLDVSFRFYNRQDSIIAIIASELSDLHDTDKGMSYFDAYQEGSLRKA